MQDFIYLAIAFITAGAALVTGLISLVIGLGKEGRKVDIFFGLLALSLFVFILLPPSGFLMHQKNPLPLTVKIKRIFSWSHYILLIWFIQYYSGYYKRLLVVSVSIAIVLHYLTMIISIPASEHPLWMIFLYLIIVTIALYGFAAAGHMKKTKATSKEGNWLLVCMVVLSFLLAISIINTYKSDLIEKTFGIKIFFPLHLNHLFFIIMMSMRLQKNTLNKYQLENILRLKNKQWGALFNSIQLFIVEIDKSGEIIYANPYTTQKLGFSSDVEIIGLNWFENFLPKNEMKKAQTAFAEIIEKSNLSPHEKSNLRSHKGEEWVINWTRVLTEDEAGKPAGLFCIGLDSTELDNAFRQVQIMKNELEKENLSLRLSITEDFNNEIIGNSEAIIYTIQKARQVSATNATVLLEGETGVGKELFADLIHRGSLRSNKPLIKVNCAALPPELIESELFGHEKGSFTGAVQTRKGRFELANGGTIFLDEIGELPLSLQPKLLRVLQSGEFQRIGGQTTIKVDVRVISATNRDLMNGVREGRFREDLFYRLNVYPITVPALKNRKEDIPLLTEHYIKKFALDFNKPIVNISKADQTRLLEYKWPGNIRELINLIERSVISSYGETLKIDWEFNNHKSEYKETQQKHTIKDREREQIVNILKECKGKINGPEGAAEILGINPNTLRSRMKKLNINRNES